MARIILIETSTALCSTALVEGEDIVCYRESTTPRAQASLTAPFVKEMLDEKGIAVGDCDAVCVSMGPGSYTGLRVGVSTAKGLCFGAGKPLLAVGTLDTLAWQAAEEGLLPEGCLHVVPMVDARRMEVYASVFRVNYADDGTLTGFSQITETTPQVIIEESFQDILSQGPVLFIGDGAGKCADVLKHPNASFAQCCPKASAMRRPAIEAFVRSEFRDIAYFEPFYLKQFVATVSQKKLF